MCPEGEPIEGWLQILNTQGSKVAATVAAVAERLRCQFGEGGITLLQLEEPFLGEVGIINLQRRQTDTIQLGAQLKKEFVGLWFEMLVLPCG